MVFVTKCRHHKWFKITFSATKQKGQFFTNHIPKDVEGNVLTDVCLSGENKGCHQRDGTAPSSGDCPYRDPLSSVQGTP